MIEFSCSGCGRPFSVADKYAGRSARCKSCGMTVVVPAAPAAPAAALPMRARRLLAEHRQMSQAFGDFPLIRFQAVDGQPPEVYQVNYAIKGLAPGEDGPVVRQQHTVEIRLGAEYPRLAPQCRMLTPAFHPNIDATTICVGDHWVAGERLVDLVIRIGQMIAYQAYNIKSPLNGQAAMWADLNGGQLPMDPRDLHPPGL